MEKEFASAPKLSLWLILMSMGAGMIVVCVVDGDDEKGGDSKGGVKPRYRLNVGYKFSDAETGRILLFLMLLMDCSECRQSIWGGGGLLSL